MKGPGKAQTVDRTPQKTVDGQEGKKPTEGVGSSINALTASLKMSKEVKMLKQLEEKEMANDKLLAQAKIDKDRKVRKEFNVGLIQAKTIEALLRFLELEPDEKPQLLD